MKTIELIALHDTLLELVKTRHKFPAKFSYAAMRNLRTLEPLVKTYQEAIDTSKWPELAAWDTARVAMLTELARKNPDGSPIMVGNEFSIPPEVDLAAAWEDLKAQHPKLMDTIKEHEAYRQEILSSDEVVSLHMVDETYLPESIEPGVMLNLLPMIN